jgi:hypothetical protein
MTNVTFSVAKPFSKNAISADDALLFIDANKYLDLYRTTTGKDQLAGLRQQADRIFVTQQVVNEVERNKVEAADFLVKQFAPLKLQTYGMPDHLFGTSADQTERIRTQMHEIGIAIKKVNTDVKALAMDIMRRVSASKDEVSVALVPIFARKVPHTPDELQRARKRKELGNPPGWKTDPIGDQLTWEQILTGFAGKRALWIISRDADFGTMYENEGFVNSFLLDEVRRIAPQAEVYFFHNIPEGIKDFAAKTGVNADKLPTPEKTEEIKEEEAALPPLSLASFASGGVVASGGASSYVPPSGILFVPDARLLGTSGSLCCPSCYQLLPTRPAGVIDEFGARWSVYLCPICGTKSRWRQ